MRCVKTLIILPMTAFHLPIVPRRKRPDDFVADPVHFQMLLEESGFFSVGGKTVGKFRSIIGLDALDGAGEGFYQMLHELSRGIGTMFLEGLYKAPSGVLVNGCVLVELLSDYLAVFQTGRRDKFYIYLNPLARIIHLFIGFWDILWVRRMNGHNSLFSEEAVKAGNGAGIATLPEFNPKDYQAGMRIPSAHIVDEFDFLRCMLVGMMVRPSGTIAQRVPGAVIAALPAVNILTVGLIFDCGFGNAKFFSILDEG